MKDGDGAMMLPKTLKAKLQMMSIVSTGVALLAACSALAVYDYHTYLASFVNDTQTYASIVAQNCTAAVSFQSEKDAAETLSSLRAEPHVVAACVYDTLGKRLATYYRDSEGRLPEVAAVTAPPCRFKPDRLEVWPPVLLNGKSNVVVCVHLDLDGLRSRTEKYFLV